MHGPRLKFLGESPFSLPWKVLLILILTVAFFPPKIYTQTQNSSASPIVLYKCSNGEVPQDFLETPEKLQIQYLEEKLDFYRTKWSNSSSALFNFTLKLDSTNQSCHSTKIIENSTFIFKIPTILEEDEVTNFEFSPDGYLVHYSEDGSIENYYHRENYCVERIAADFLHLRVCKSQCFFKEEEKGSHPCLSKCCPIGQVMTSRNVTSTSNSSVTSQVKIGCQDSLQDDWTPLFEPEECAVDYDPRFPQKGGQNVQIPNLQYSPGISGSTKCGQGGKISLGKKKWLTPLFKGQTQHNDSDQVLSFCADGFWEANKHVVYEPEKSLQFVRMCQKKVQDNLTGSTVNSSSTGNSALVTVSEEDIEFHGRVLFAVAFVASFVHFLTLLVYVSLGTNQNVHGLVVLAVSVSQFLLNVLLCTCSGIHIFVGVRAWFQRDAKSCSKIFQPNLMCLVVGILHQFLLISSFSWSTVLTFDAWSKIRSITPSVSLNSKGRKRFLKYCSIGFGFPFVYVIMSTYIEFGISQELEWPGLIRPGYTKTCVILQGWNYLIYITLPILFLFLMNITMAVLTVKVLLDAKKNMKSFTDSDTSSSFKNKASLILKLFILMGIFLIFEIMLAFWSPIKISRYFITFDLYRVGNAVGLFWIFVMNKKVHNQLCDRYPSIKRYVTSHLNTNATTVTNVSKDFSSKSTA